MMESNRDPLDLMLGATWEEAKGKLRACIVLKMYERNFGKERPAWLDLQKVVNEFIEKVDDTGLCG